MGKGKGQHYLADGMGKIEYEMETGTKGHYYLSENFPVSRKEQKEIDEMYPSNEGAYIVYAFFPSDPGDGSHEPADGI